MTDLDKVDNPLSRSLLRFLKRNKIEYTCVNGNEIRCQITDEWNLDDLFEACEKWQARGDWNAEVWCDQENKSVDIKLGEDLEESEDEGEENFDDALIQARGIVKNLKKNFSKKVLKMAFTQALNESLNESEVIETPTLTLANVVLGSDGDDTYAIYTTENQEFEVKLTPIYDPETDAFGADYSVSCNDIAVAQNTMMEVNCDEESIIVLKSDLKSALLTETSEINSDILANIVIDAASILTENQGTGLIWEAFEI
jgi:hypothetical protein